MQQTYLLCNNNLKNLDIILLSFFFYARKDINRGMMPRFLGLLFHKKCVFVTSVHFELSKLYVHHQLEVVYFHLDLNARHFKLSPLSIWRCYHSKLRIRLLHPKTSLCSLLHACDRLCKALLKRIKSLFELWKVSQAQSWILKKQGQSWGANSGSREDLFWVWAGLGGERQLVVGVAYCGYGPAHQILRPIPRPVISDECPHRSSATGPFPPARTSTAVFVSTTTITAAAATATTTATVAALPHNYIWPSSTPDALWFHPSAVPCKLLSKFKCILSIKL